MSAAATAAASATAVVSKKRRASRTPKRNAEAKTETIVESADSALVAQKKAKTEGVSAQDDKARESFPKKDNECLVSVRYSDLWLSIELEPGKGLGVKLLQDVFEDKPLGIFMIGTISADNEKEEDSHSVTLVSSFPDGPEKRWCMLPIRSELGEIDRASIAFYVNEPGPGQTENCTVFPCAPLPDDNERRIRLPILQTVGNVKAGTFLNWHYGDLFNRQGKYTPGKKHSDEELKAKAVLLIPSLSQLTDAWEICHLPSNRFWHRSSYESLHFHSLDVYARRALILLSPIDITHVADEKQVQLLRWFTAQLAKDTKSFYETRTPGQYAARLIGTYQLEKQSFDLICSIVPSARPVVPFNSATAIAKAL